jgi:hypothetical protein
MSAQNIPSHDQLVKLFNTQVCDDVGCSLDPPILQARAVNLCNVLARMSMHAANILSVLDYESKFVSQIDHFHQAQGRLQVNVRMDYCPPGQKSQAASFAVTEKFLSGEKLPQYFTSHDPDHGIGIDIQCCRTAEDISLKFLSFVLDKVKPEDRHLFMTIYTEYAMPELSNPHLLRLEH